jgi:hypothetical protein
VWSASGDRSEADRGCGQRLVPALEPSDNDTALDDVEAVAVVILI